MNDQMMMMSHLTLLARYVSESMDSMQMLAQLRQCGNTTNISFCPAGPNTEHASACRWL